MARLKASGDREFLQGIPELWTVVLDRMAHDESIGDIRTALRRELAVRLDDLALQGSLMDLCLSSFRLTNHPDLASTLSELARGERLAEDWIRLVRHQLAALLLAADRIAAIIESGHPGMVLAHRYPRQLVHEVARLIGGSPKALHHLNDWISQGNRRALHPLAASLLHAVTPGWRLDPGCRLRLEGASLDEVAWPGLNLAGLNLRDAELRNADLSGAKLDPNQA